jgi:hypothetical protein
MWLPHKPRTKKSVFLHSSYWHLYMYHLAHSY